MDIKNDVRAMEAEMIARRRDFHKYAEGGWTEFRTTSLIAQKLEDLGYPIVMGRDIHVAEDRMGVPTDTVLEKELQRAVEQGAVEKYLPAMKGGFTGVLAVLDCGKGPVTALRFDIDAVDVRETDRAGHRPADEGFNSLNPTASHACAHDGHASIGLAVAELLMKYRSALRGTIKIFFQAAEEGVRGAKSLVSKGLFNDVEQLIGMHLISGQPLHYMSGGRSDFLATEKINARFIGAPSHAGGTPERGRNALQAAAAAVMNLYAIPRHSGGATRINVGKMSAGTGRNVIAPEAMLALETRGVTSELNDYMYAYATRILKNAAEMHGCSLETASMGAAKSGFSDEALVTTIVKTAEKTGVFSKILRQPPNSLGSEDFTYMMEAVQKRGGMAAYMDIGADLGGWAHHTEDFDFAEEALPLAVELIVSLILEINGENA